jgi:hypothetical protein
MEVSVAFLSSFMAWYCGIVCVEEMCGIGCA